MLCGVPSRKSQRLKVIVLEEDYKIKDDVNDIIEVISLVSEDEDGDAPARQARPTRFTCDICYVERNNSKKFYYPCKHYICKVCAGKWNRSHSICPMCRRRTEEKLEKPQLKSINSFLK